MSFVLDAQQKQDTEQTPHLAARLAYEKAARRNRIVWIAVALAVTVGAVLAAWTFWPRPEATPTSVNPAPLATVISPPQLVPQVRIIARERVPVAPAPRREALPLVDVSELGSGDQNSLLSFSYSSHIFNEEASMRTVVVDGRSLAIGETHKGWAVQTITEDGVIWSNSDVRVRVPVLEMWDR